jgi:hypothetical protein
MKKLIVLAFFALQFAVIPNVPQITIPAPTCSPCPR